MEHFTRYFEVGFRVSENVYSVNIITANTGSEELEAATETAQREAAQHGYTVGYVTEISERDADAARRKGMPMYPIDAEAERAHTPRVYRYYCRMRPPMPGAIPRAGLVRTWDYNWPQSFNGVTAWGFVEYSRELTADEISAYELAPATGNPLNA